VSLGRLLAIGGAAGPGLLARFAEPAVAAELNAAAGPPDRTEGDAGLLGGTPADSVLHRLVAAVAAGAATHLSAPAGGPIAVAGARIHVLPAGCTFELAGRRPSIVDVPAGERGPVS